MNTSTDTSTVLVSTPTVVSNGKVTGPKVPTTSTYNLQVTAKEAVAAMADAAEADSHGLVAAWNAGVAYRWAVDNGTKVADFIAAVLAADDKGYARRRKAESKGTWSKYGKLVTTWSTYQEMEEAVIADGDSNLSLRDAYALAVRLSASGTSKGDKAAPIVVRIDKGADVADIAAKLVAAGVDVDALMDALTK